jgi:transcriptional regulator with XRE-family HTH domain
VERDQKKMEAGNMDVGERLKQLRELKGLSQGKVEERTGLFRCYVSRVENGHTVPSLDTLEKFAQALDVPLYQLFYEGEKPPQLSKLQSQDMNDWASGRKGRRIFGKLLKAIRKMSPSDRTLLLHTADKMFSRKRPRAVTAPEAGYENHNRFRKKSNRI